MTGRKKTDTIGRETQQRLLLAFGTGGRRSAPGRAGTRSKRYHDAAGHRAVAAEAGPGSEGGPTAVPGLLGGESPPPLAVSYAAEKPCVPPSGPPSADDKKGMTRYDSDCPLHPLRRLCPPGPGRGEGENRRLAPCGCDGRDVCLQHQHRGAGGQVPAEGHRHVFGCPSDDRKARAVHRRLRRRRGGPPLGPPGGGHAPWHPGGPGRHGPTDEL